MIIRLCTDTQFSCEQRILWYNQHCIVCSMQCILTTTHWQDYSMTAIRSWRWWKEKKSVPSGHLHTCQIFSMRWCWLIVIDCPEGLGGTWSDGHGNGNGGNAALELEDGLRLQWVGDDDFLGIFSMSWVSVVDLKLELLRLQSGMTKGQVQRSTSTLQLTPFSFDEEESFSFG